MEKNIQKNRGHWQIKNILKRLLLECKAKENTRYAIDGIHVAKNEFVATDGRRLIEIVYKHEIELGNYFLTQDGFLLGFLDGKFPKYNNIIPVKNTLRKILETKGEGENIIGLILGELCYAGCICKLSLYNAPANLLSKIVLGTTEVFVNKDKPAEHPFLIEAKTTLGFVRYLQMPITVKNKVS